MIGTIETELHKNGYFTMLQSVSRSSDILSLVKNWNVDGMILVFPTYKKALEDSHIPFRPEYIFSYPPSYEGGIEAGRAIAGSKSPITAVVTTADICAIGIMEGARLGGYRVPIDLSVIGYDNLNL